MDTNGLLGKVIEGCFNEIFLIEASTSTYLHVNQTAQKSLGYTFNELQHMRPWQIAREFTQADWQRQLEPLLSGQQPKIDIKTYHTCKNGVRYPVILHVLRNTSEENDILVVISTDISIQQNAIEAASESDARYSGIISNLPGVVFQMLLRPDDMTRYLFLSANCDNTLGFTPEALYLNSSRFTDSILPEDQATFHSSMRVSAQAQTPWNWEGRIWVEQWSDIKWLHLRAMPRKMSGTNTVWEGIITDITERKLISVENHLYRQRLGELSAHIERIKEQERTRIAREIHDEMGGNLVAVKMVIHTLENRLPEDQPWLKEKTQYMDTLIDRSIEAGHRIARDLRPSVLDLGIIPALEWQVKEFEKQYGIRCSFSTNKFDIALTSEHSTAIFRMVQEALTNIAKHANASYASLAIIYTRTAMSITIADNGCGLMADHGRKPNSFGLLGMSERCKEIGGTILVDSQPENGCVIAIKIPLMLPEKNIILPSEDPQNEQLSLL